MLFLLCHNTLTPPTRHFAPRPAPLRFVFDFEVTGVFPDEGDVGYYDDDVVSVENFEKLKENIRLKGKERGEGGLEGKLEEFKGEKGVLEPDRR